MKRSAQIGLFLGSYAPLFVLLALLEWDNDILGSFPLYGFKLHFLALSFVILALIGVVLVLSFLYVARQLSPIIIKPKVVERNAQETLAYLITYLIPFIGFQFEAVNNLVANGVIFAMIGFLYIQSDMIYLNPILSILGYKLIKIEVDGDKKLMLAKNKIKSDNEATVTIISEGLYIESK